MRRGTPRLLWLAIALLLMLGALAVLQYRWLGEVSEAGRERMMSTLRSRAEQFTEEFDREIARAFFWLQVEPDAFDRNDWRRYSDRYERWLAGAAHPRLVKEVWLFAPDAVARRFDPAARAFLPAPVPGSLQALATQGAADARWFHTIREDIPAIVAPIPQIVSFVSGRDVRIQQLIPGTQRARTAIVLDAGYIRGELLPLLAARAFGGVGATDYHVAVRTHDGAREVFSYGPPLERESGAPDISLDLFDVRLDTIADLRTSAQGAGARAETFQLPALPGVVIKTTEPTNEPPHPQRFAVSVVQRDGQPRGVARMSLPAPRWQLTVRHRAGSLEAAVAAARRRNLVLSGGILALFASSVILLVISVQRASRLAAQQVEFVAAVSHELRTPLAVIRSAGENLADGVVDEPDQVRRYGELVRNEGTRLSSMVEQVLAFGGMRGGQALRRHAADVRAVVQQGIEGAWADLNDAGVRVEVGTAEGLPPLLLDGDAIARAIANLLSNAAKYARDGGRVRIAIAMAPVRSGHELRISVEDRGPGIAPDDLPHVFEPFYRSSSVIASPL